MRIAELRPHCNVEQRALFWDIFKRVKAYCQGGDKAAGKALGEWDNQRWQLDVPAPFQGDVAGRSNLIFLEARGGCGKTYVMNALMAACRAMAVVAMAT